jgi:DNA-binding CsgD family transcriptional regulator
VTAAGLLERDDELSAIESLLDGAAAGAGRALVITGEAGIGKTALLVAASARARERGFGVLNAAGGMLEGDFPFGIARRLFEPVTAAEPLAGAAVAAAPALGLASSSAALGQGAASFELQHGLYWLVANLAERAPLLLSIDDAQWADADSLRWLVYLARRVGELPVALVVAVREGEPTPAHELLAALREHATETAPEPLSEAATARLVRAALAGAPDEFCHACHETSGGNPFLLGALIDDLAAEHATSVERVREVGPAAVQRSVLLRLARLGPAAVALAQAVAVFGRDADLVDAAALAELDEPAARTAADALMAARVLESAHPLRFAHPLLGSAVYADVGLARRAAGHRRAAELLEERAPERAVLHLLSTYPSADAWVLERLRAGAEHALARGSADGAHALLERALDEAPVGEPRAEVLFALGEVERRLGQASAPERFEGALQCTADPALRLRSVRELAYLRIAEGGFPAARDLFERALRDLPADDAEGRLELEADLLALLGIAAPTRERTDLDVRLTRLAEGDSPAARRLLITLAFDRLIDGRGTGAEAARLVGRALAGGRLVGDVGPAHPMVLSALSVLQQVEHDAEVDAHVEAGLASARARGAAAEVALMLTVRGRLALFRGELREAEADTRDALRVGDPMWLDLSWRFAAAALIWVLIERGELEAAEAELTRHPEADMLRPGATRWQVLQARAALRRAQGRFAEAVEDSERAAQDREGTQPLLGDAMTALSLHGLGRDEEARVLAAGAAAHAERWGVPGTLGMALRVQGVVEGGEDGLALLRRAAETLAPTPRRLEHARALVDLGAALRRANQRAEAREPLAAGMELAHRCGASVLVEQARVELRACGARPRRVMRSGVDALTTSELRVAQLAAAGRTNREIAQTLFVTRKTVETHLAAVYRKLDVNERERLSELLAAKDQGPSPEASAARPREAVAP